MTTHIALLRAINVGGTAKLSMADLRAFFVELGFADARTLLQTGNVVFDAGRQKVSMLEKLFRAEAQQRLGLETDFMLRSAVDWQSLIARNPFDQAAQNDPSHLVMMALSAAPTALAVAEVAGCNQGPRGRRSGRCPALSDLSGRNRPFAFDQYGHRKKAWRAWHRS